MARLGFAVRAYLGAYSSELVEIPDLDNEDGQRRLECRSNIWRSDSFGATNDASKNLPSKFGILKPFMTPKKRFHAD